MQTLKRLIDPEKFLPMAPENIEENINERIKDIRKKPTTEGFSTTEKPQSESENLVEFDRGVLPDQNQVLTSSEGEYYTSTIVAKTTSTTNSAIGRVTHERTTFESKHPKQ